MKNKMKMGILSHIGNNGGLKLLSILFAVVLWLVIVNVADPVNTQTFRNISVTIQHDEVVTDKGKTYQVVDSEQTISVVIKAKRSILSKIKADDIVATADLRELEIESLVPVTISITGFEGNYVEATATPGNIQVKIEDASSNKFPITATSTGKVASGYALGQMDVAPETITVSGPESMISSIARVTAEVSVAGLQDDTTIAGDRVTLSMYDENDKEIDQSLLTTDMGDGLTVNVEILHTKEVALSIVTSGTPAAGYTVAETKCEPKHIEVAGSEKDLEDLETIRISGEEVNIEDAKDKKEFVVDINDFLPEGVSLVDSSVNTVAVSVMIDKLGTKKIEFPVASIEVKNSPNSLKLSYGGVTNMDLSFTGAADSLDNLTVGKVSASIDLSQYTAEGNYDVPVTVTVPEEYQVTGNTVVHITLSK